MYNSEKRCWISEKYDEYILKWCREPYNSENPEAMYIIADSLLEKTENGKGDPEAVYLMEKAAKLGYSKASFAMATLFRYGWSVGKSKKRAMQWYTKAAEQGNREAAALLAEIKRKKIIRTAVIIGLLALAAVISAAVIISLPTNGIKLHKDTLHTKTASLEDFSKALNEIVLTYDDELVVSGERGSNRLLLKFEGSGIDLSDFPADIVLDNGDNYLIVQFGSEEEAKKCLEYLKSLKNIVFAEEDNYESYSDMIITPDDLASTAEPYTSSHTGLTYYSWGVEYLGYDILGEWLMTQKTEEVVVAVIDTGSEPCSENKARYLDGFDVFDPSHPNGWRDTVGHGTHVAGTIFDCTRGLDVMILPIRLTDSRYMSTSNVVMGLQLAIQSDVDVINMSLGGPCNTPDTDGNCGSPEDYYIRDAISKGIIVVVSAGNGDQNGVPVDTENECPSHIDEAIIVAACDRYDKLASFSNYGDSVDVCAPGVEVVSFYPGGTLEALDGTSMAAPHIAALAAMLRLTMPDKTTAQIEKYITDYCVNMGKEQYYGSGIPWAGYFAGD